MTTATESTPATQPAKRAGRPPLRNADQLAHADLAQAVDATETAVAAIVRGTVETTRTLLPSAVTRPTETVDLVFDLVEQVVAASRRVTRELAAAVEEGIQGSTARLEHAA